MEFEGHSGSGSGVVHQILERFKSRVEMFENVFAALFRIERLTRYEFVDEYGFSECTRQAFALPPAVASAGGSRFLL